MLGIRRREGLDLADVPAAGRRAVAGLISDGLLEGVPAVRDRRLVLTQRGRLLADLVMGRLLGL